VKADPAAQRRLLDIQTVDTTVGQVDHRIKTLPEHAVVAQLVARRNDLGQRYVAAQTQLSDAQAAQDKAESDLGPVRERLARDERRVEQGLVSDARALNSLNDEITHLKKRISDLEDLELEAMEALDEATASRDAILTEKAALDAEAKEVVTKRDTQIADLTAERDAQLAQRSQLVTAVPAPLLDLYEKLRARSNGIGASELRGKRCSGCGLEATQTAYDGYLAAPPDEVLRCEECDRILVRDPSGTKAG
jgi:predicted  nucleic acid-binding Zn-ribbon protein